MKSFFLKLLACLLVASCPAIPADCRAGSGFVVRLAHEGRIHHLGLEEYVGGVLLAEVGPGWPEEALKAMAVCARTFALERMMANHDRNYHLTGTTADQVYRAGYREHPSLVRAVRDTAGQVLAADGRLARVFYHASSGGATACVDSVWGGGRIGHLGGVADPYSVDDPYSNWSFTLDPDEFRRLLGLSPGNTVESAGVSHRHPCGRAETLAVRLSGGSSRLFSARELREKQLGTERLRSTFFEVGTAGGRISFRGHGWGHGVGLSQWGARRMAESGFDYRDILSFYFPGTELRRARLAED